MCVLQTADTVVSVAFGYIDEIVESIKEKQLIIFVKYKFKIQLMLRPFKSLSFYFYNKCSSIFSQQ